MEKELQYQSHIQSIPEIRKDLEETSKQWDIPRSELRQIILIIEELFSNTIRFAYNDEREHYIRIRLKRTVREICIEMIDDGIPFNPLEYKLVLKNDPSASDDGGMGLTLIRTFSDSISYSREGEMNHLFIRKIIRSSPQKTG
jgi:anti-sigma regulatory factor (Ser/Thr protein kinase)